MQLIGRVQVKYFRSIYATSLKSCAEMNVISGQNDVGKSNVLRALNLYFNGKTDWETDLQFQRDFSIQRLEQVRKESVKGKQFIQVAIDFIRPDNYKGSLPPKFTVKRTWYRDQSQYSQTDNLQQLSKAGKCPSSLETAQRMLPKFLNRVHYEYVPAVKDRAFFNHLLGRLQSSLLGVSLDEENPITPLTDKLATHIGNQLTELRDDFSRATGLSTSFEPPSELSSLFRAFEVSVPSGDSQIALGLRGDGMQARYIPSVLHFIAANSGSFFVWGFEEPENSLEYRNADRLAEDFENIYSNEAQIFLTSHSPAIVARDGDRISCYRVYQELEKTEVEKVALPLSKTASGSKLSHEIGLLRIQQEIHKEFSAKLQEFEAIRGQIASLEADLATLKTPLIIVEGKSDVAILNTAWEKLFPGKKMPFSIRSADPLENHPELSGAGTGSLAKTIESIHPLDGRRVIAVFDHDDAGIRAFEKLSKNFKGTDGAGYCKLHSNGLAVALTLAEFDPESPEVEQQNLCIELLFDEETLATTNDEGRGLQIESKPILVVAGNSKTDVPTESHEALKDLIDGFHPPRQIVGGKTIFSEEIVPQLGVEKFSEFRKLFKLLENLLK